MSTPATKVSPDEERKQHAEVVYAMRGEEPHTTSAMESASAGVKSALDSVVHAIGGVVVSAKEQVGSVMNKLAHLADPLSKSELEAMDAYFRAANYLTIGQIYLRENPLLQEPLKIEHIKPRLLGHWGTSPGLSILYIHMNRIITKYGVDAIYLAGPGHGGPAIVAQTYLEGTYTEIYPEVTQDLPGLRKLFRQFSAPGGIPSHVSPNVPGSIHEGGELGYVLTHAYGAVMDNPDLIALAVVGDGEAETGPLEGSWKSVSFVNPVYDGAVLPVLHLNGYKISGPTVMGRESDVNIQKYFESFGYEPIFVEGHEPAKVHQLLAKTMDYCIERIRSIQQVARSAGRCDVRPQWPLIVLRTPKGWTGPRVIDNKKVEDTFRAHQVPLATVRENEQHFRILEEWMRSYKVEELFDAHGKFKANLAALAPKGDKRMSAQPYTNGGKGAKPLLMPDITKFALPVVKPASELKQSVAQLGQLCRDLYALNPHSFRLFCPDETNSNRLGAVFETQKRAFMETTVSYDEAVGHDGRVMEVLSEHCCNGWLEGYILTGRHGLLATYEAFSMIFNSMTLQMVKWLEVVNGTNGEIRLDWRKAVPSINLLLTSTCWRNDHNGFSHQGPSFVDTLLNKKGSIARAYFPIDANTLLCTAEHCLTTQNRVNLIVQDKQPQLQYLSMEEAREHFKAKMSRFDWASNDLKDGSLPDIIIASCGDVMTQEALAATACLRQHAPSFRVRFVNVLDLMALYAPPFHPHGVTPEKFEQIFTKEVDVVFSYHAYPGSLHQLLHGRPNPTRFHVRGYEENGTTTTPFDMVVLNKASRFHLVELALKHTKNPPPNKNEILALCEDTLARHKKFSVEQMEDLKEIREWTWPF